MPRSQADAPLEAVARRRTDMASTFRVERNADKESGTRANRRLDLQRSADQRQPLPYAGEAEADAKILAGKPGHRRIAEAAAVVLDRDAQGILQAIDDDTDDSNATRVLRDIGKGLLNDPIDGRADLIRQLIEAGIAVLEVDVDAETGAP